MSSTSTTNTQASIASASSIGFPIINTTSNLPLITNSSYSTALSDLMDGLQSFPPKLESNYKIELTKSENGGFVIQVYVPNPKEVGFYNKRPKIYINKEIENLGKDIQNALMIELMKE